MAAREAKIKQQEERIAKWEEEKKAGKSALKGSTVGGGTLVSPVNGKEDKNAMREFYKTVRSKPKGKTQKGTPGEYDDK